MIPDFLKKNEVRKDMTALNEMDMLQEALDKQEKQNQASGMSMAELLRKKREETEKALASKTGPSKSEMEERKARL